MIQQHFEPVWVSVRPVPQITIDFGNGHTVHRTLHGNVATWICFSDGSVLDILPGVYSPEFWNDELQQLAALHADILKQGVLESTRRQAVHAYHTAALKQPQRSFRNGTEAKAPVPGLPYDTIVNQTVRRKKIHRSLQNVSVATPQNTTAWLYREVLKIDLTDPYLGLGPMVLDQTPVEDMK